MLPHDESDVACSEFIGLGGMMHVQLQIMYVYSSCSLQLLPCPKKKKYRHPLYPKTQVQQRLEVGCMQILKLQEPRSSRF